MSEPGVGELLVKCFVFIGISLTLLLGACSGDDGDSEGDDDGGPSATRATDGSSTEEPDDADDEDGGSGDSDFHACSLFTGAELSEALGIELSDGRDYLATAQGATNCTWEGDAVLFVEVLLEGGQDWYDAIHIPDSAAGEVEEIEGLGDVAVWDDFLNSVDVVDGDRFIAVQTIGFAGDPDNKGAAVRVAEMALERLP